MTILANGTRVRTTKRNKKQRKEWTEKGWASKREGVMGVIVGYSDGHGLCYKVKHEDNDSEGWYDPSEFEVLEAVA